MENLKHICLRRGGDLHYLLVEFFALFDGSTTSITKLVLLTNSYKYAKVSPNVNAIVNFDPATSWENCLFVAP